jgi:hypothetical protein
MAAERRMDLLTKRRELEVKLARCRALSDEFRGPETLKNISELATEIEAEIQELDKRARLRPAKS